MKAYSKPNITVERIELQAILAGSTGLEDVKQSNEEFAGGVVDSRRGGRSIWDDDED